MEWIQNSDFQHSDCYKTATSQNSDCYKTATTTKQRQLQNSDSYKTATVKKRQKNNILLGPIQKNLHLKIIFKEWVKKSSNF